MVQVAQIGIDGKITFVEEDIEPITDPITFKPIEPAPFWRAAFEMCNIKIADVLSSISDPDERYLVELDITRRKTYLREDPMISQLALLQGITPEQMDDLWLHVQENYK